MNKQSFIESTLIDCESLIRASKDVKEESFLDSGSFMFGDHSLRSKIDEDENVLRRLRICLDVLRD